MSETGRHRGKRGGTGRLVLAIVLLAGASYGGWRWMQAGGDLEALRRLNPMAQTQGQGKDQANAPRPAPAVPVQAAAASRMDVPIYASGLGAIQAFNTVTVRSRVDGELQKVAFTEGQMVKQGDLLVQIDPRPFQAVLDGALAKKTQDEAQLANTKRDLARYTELASRDYASRQQVETQQSAVAQQSALLQADQATIDNARTQLSYTTIKAPISGKTGLRLVDQGNIVRASDPTGLVTIAQLQPIAALFTVAERYLNDVRKAAAAGPVKIWALAQDAKTELAEGSLTLVNNEVDQATGTIRLKATFANDQSTLWPGQFVNMRLLLETLPGALTVPSDAVMRGQQGLYVYRVKDDDTVEVRILKVGPMTGGIVVVEDGLAAGDRVVTAGQYRLQAGTRVQVSGPGANNQASLDGAARTP
jgi:multidrug efflux system membrane fusion protein